MSLCHRIRMAWIVVICSIVSLAGSAAAHEASTVELRLDVEQNRMLAELDLLDLDFVLGLRKAGARQISAGDVMRSEQEIRRYVKQNLRLTGCALVDAPGPIGLRQGNASRVIAGFDLDCTGRTDTIELRSAIFDDLSGYRTLLTVESGSAQQVHVADDGYLRVGVEKRSRLAGFGSFVGEGVRHILGGFDHLLFLLLLILPLVRRDSFRQCFLAVAGIVTAFTFAHSITLTLSSQGFLSLPAKPVEILIAASVVLVAIMNLAGKSDRIAWPVAYVFGLIHGFGFAGAFAELASGSAIRWTELLAFNLGVEAGQLIVIAVALLLLRPLSRVRLARPMLLPAGSIVAGFVGAMWIFERL